jgi:hypothetical protein
MDLGVDSMIPGEDQWKMDIKAGFWKTDHVDTSGYSRV